jgi:hypothetical protein
MSSVQSAEQGKQRDGVDGVDGGVDRMGGTRGALSGPLRESSCNAVKGIPYRGREEPNI